MFHVLIQSKLCKTPITLGKWQGVYTILNIKGDRYIQVNFAENIRQLKILGSCPVTVIYRAVVYRFGCNCYRLLGREGSLAQSVFCSMQ